MVARSSLLVLSLFVTNGAGRAAAPATAPAVVARRQPPPDVRELLGAARGVAPVLCVLAADGITTVGRWGGGMWDAPAVSIGPEVRTRVREMMRARFSADDQRALLDGL